VEVLAEDIALRSGSGPFEITPAAMQLLAAQAWRGNTRELRNVLEQAAMRSESALLDAQDVAQVLRESGVEQVPPASVAAVAAPQGANVLRPLGEQVAELERNAIQAALAATGGNKVAAARMLGISRAKLYERLDEVSETQTSV
jgi:DNA-binding NtrC family response regulator